MTHSKTSDPYGDAHERYSYRSELIESLRAGDGTMSAGRVTVHTARSFGFCWGVDRAVAMVRDAIDTHADGNIWLLDQIIHNPRVNADFKRAGVRFMRGPFAEENPGSPGPNDAIIIPAFSARVEDMNHLKELGCAIIDTTCPWVVRPHRRTLRYVEDGYTTVIHGLVRHEETAASCSLIASEGGQFVVVADRREAERLCEYILGRLSGAELLKSFSPGVCSDGFDPEVHLSKIGTINQTTMLASETREIESLIRAAMLERDGHVEQFRELNTICKATQENQDAVSEMADRGELDMVIVVGGYDSSNTRNLTRVGSGRFPSYHVIGPEAIDAQTIRHRDQVSGELVSSENWLPEGKVNVGFTAGASTPDTLLGDTVGAVLAAAGESIPVATPS
ncbi:MAG: 4-hydroxy-3-methylbut-2-enyl diphosphate reductase [Pseudohongiellaceae bacterium]|jgi:4-hydroxy-3-methylbut-2-enyl diphosphate reductase